MQEENKGIRAQVLMRYCSKQGRQVSTHELKKRNIMCNIKLGAAKLTWHLTPVLKLL